MRRETIGSSAHSAKLGSSSRSTARKVKHNKTIPTVDTDSGRNDSPKGVPFSQPYGFAYWPKSQDEEEDKGKGQQQGGGGNGGGAFEDDDQPKGPSAIGSNDYANGNRSDPQCNQLQDPRYQMMLENDDDDDKGGGAGGGAAGGGGGGSKKEDHGGREGDIALYHHTKKMQFQFATGDEKSGLKQGAYLTADAKSNKIRLQLVDAGQDDQKQQQSLGVAGGGGQQKKQKKPDGQRPLLKKESTTFIDIDGGNTIHLRHGSTHVKLTGEKTIGYYEDETKSFMVDKEHVHIRFMKLRVWIDKDGIWSTAPILVKQDVLDKD